MDGKSFLLLPMVIQYLLPAVLLGCIMNPFVDGKLDKEVVATVALLMSLTAIPILESISFSLARLDRNYVRLKGQLQWYWDNCDFRRAHILSTREDRESMEYAYALVRFYNTGSVILLAYGTALAVYGLFNTAGIDFSAPLLKVPLLVNTLRVPVIYLIAAFMLFGWLLHIQFVNRYQEYYSELVPELAMRVEASHGHVVKSLCGELAINLQRGEVNCGMAAPRQRPAYKVLVGSILESIAWPKPKKIVGTEDDQFTASEFNRLRITVRPPPQIDVCGELCVRVDEYGRYSVEKIPHSLHPYTLTLHLDSWSSTSWEQRFDEKRAIYGRYETALVLPAW